MPRDGERALGPDKRRQHRRRVVGGLEHDGEPVDAGAVVVPDGEEAGHGEAAGPPGWVLPEGAGFASEVTWWRARSSSAAGAAFESSAHNGDLQS